jgi:23S rRNA pseudouridine1911/1915/1917 synthase
MNIIQWLQIHYPESSMATLRSLLKAGRVYCQGKRVIRADTPLEGSEKIEVLKKRFTISDRLEILFEDRDLVVVNKGEGLLSVATDFEKEGTAHALLKRRRKSPCVYPVHRLDRETSGVMVFAYSEQARHFLKNLFYKHEITREYIAIVEGHLAKDRGTWQSYLEEDALYRVKSVDEGKGQLAITHFEVLKKMEKSSLLRLTLETGRKNQIRVHASESGHPILGDQKYGSKSDGRLALHAHLLSFVHPVTGKLLSFTSPPPFVKDLRELAKRRTFGKEERRERPQPKAQKQESKHNSIRNFLFPESEKKRG